MILRKATICINCIEEKRKELGYHYPPRLQPYQKFAGLGASIRPRVDNIDRLFVR